MPRDERSSRWQDFGSGKPLAVEGGISTTKRRGKMAETWWSQRFVDVLESYGLGGRMERGRRYARRGQIVSLDVSPGLLDARVQGSRPDAYYATVELRPPTAHQWKNIDDVLRSRVGFAARLLAGEVPPDLEDVFRDAGVSLFPSTWADVNANCTCPDWGNPCKHLAAVLYVFADMLDADPWLLLLWRGRSRDEILSHVRDVASAAEAIHDLPPWWPLVPGRSPPPEGRVDLPIAEPPDPPHRVLQRLAPSVIDVGDTTLEAALEPAYRALTEPELPPIE
jgi:uncharacterized Zn finger protein